MDSNGEDFLHVSKSEQQRRLMDRIINQQKNWKFSMSDINERQYWDQYQKLYEEMISKTSKDISPWYIVPADNKWYTRYIVALITLHALKKSIPSSQNCRLMCRPSWNSSRN